MVNWIPGQQIKLKKIINDEINLDNNELIALIRHKNSRLYYHAKIKILTI